MERKSLDTRLTFKPKFKTPKNAKINHVGIEQEGMMFWENAGNGFTVAVTHYTSDPNKRTKEWFDLETKKLRPDQVQREYEIDFESRAGQKAFWYLERDPDRWYIPNIPLKKVPQHWRIIAGLDYGGTNPTSINFYGIDERRRFYSLWEFYKPSGYREIARALKGTLPGYEHPLWERCSLVAADPSIWSKRDESETSADIKSKADLLEAEGIHKLERGVNDRTAGLERVKDMLRYMPKDQKAKPYLFICKRCVNQWRELGNLVYDEIPAHLMSEKNLKEDIKKKDDHSYDNLRYALMSVNNPSSKIEAPKAKKGTLEAVEKDFDRQVNEESEIDFF